ncbi:MAG: hypothetical protein AABW82_02240 [Nanoarchaeota archaeon]
MKKMSELIKIWKEIFFSIKYLGIAIFGALIFYIVNVLITNSGNLIYSFRYEGISKTLSLLKIFLLTFHQTILPSSVITLILISILTGILIGLLAFRFQKVNAFSGKVGFFTGIGVFLGMLAPGCISCGIGLSGILGLGASLAFLPFKGLEISFLAIIFLLFSIVKISLAIVEPLTCKIDRNLYSHNMKGGNKK